MINLRIVYHKKFSKSRCRNFEWHIYKIHHVYIRILLLITMIIVYFRLPETVKYRVMEPSQSVIWLLPYIK